MNVENRTLDHIIQRAHRYEHASGVSEITIGGFLLLGALTLQLGYSVFGVGERSESLLPLLSAALLIALVALGALAFAKGIDALKERFVYPRTGYVQYHHDGAEQKRFVQRATWLAIGLMVLLSPFGNAVYIMFGLLLGYGFVYFGWKTGLARLYLHAFVFLVVAFALPLLNIEGVNLDVSYLVITGVYLLSAGGLAFWRYLARFQVQDQQP